MMRRAPTSTKGRSSAASDVYKRRVLCADMGTDDQRIVSTTVGELSSIPGGRLNCLVFPASLSGVEEKALLRWSKSG